MPDPGAYKVLSSFEMEHRAALPKTNYYSFGLSASREQMNRCYNPMENSPRGSETRHMPGPGEYKYRNMTIGGHEGKHFSFLKRTTNVQGKQAVLVCDYSLRQESYNHMQSDFIHKLLSFLFLLHLYTSTPE